MEQIKHLLSEAHAEFRRLRSGELGDNLRSQGIDYKTIWGLESYRMKEIAEHLRIKISETADEVAAKEETAEALAVELWKEDVRESKMLATRLFPIEKMTRELAETWSNEVKFTELADQLCMNLLSRVPFADELAQQWISKENGMQRYMGLQMAIRRDLSIPEAKEIAQDSAQPIWIRTAAAKLAID